VALSAEGHGKDARLLFTTNVEDSVAAGPKHPIRVAFDPVTAEPAPYVTVRDGLEALISRPVYYELVERGEVQGDRFGIWSNGAFFSLGEAPCAS
jgi:hypothetical protein